MNPNYTIPAEIKALFTEDFYKAMWDELANVFKGAIVGVDPSGFPNVEQFGGTCGWHDAFFKCAPKEAIDHFDTLDWFDGDLFDDEIGEELSKRFTKRSNADRIRAMTDEKLAEMFSHSGKYFCHGNGYDPHSERCDYGYDCEECWLDWLRQEASE